MSANNAYRVQATEQGMRFVLLTESERSPQRRYEEPVIMPRPAMVEPNLLSRIDEALGDNILQRIKNALRG